MKAPEPGQERRVTDGEHNCILTNTAVWSPDGEWIVYDTRSDPAGTRFDGENILAVRVGTGETRELYRARNGAFCGVATFHPAQEKVIFILGPEQPTPEWSYNAWHRQGVIVDAGIPARATHLDARDIVPPYTPGALRGGSHLHVWEPEGNWVSFTYEDHVLAQGRPGAAKDVNARNVGVSVPGAVQVPRTHPRNHDGQYYSVLVTRTHSKPAPGSDEISRACEEGWVGTRGYVRTDGSRQRRALAFQGTVVTGQGESSNEVFIADLPSDIRRPGPWSLAGTEERLPCPPEGVVQRRLTWTADRRYPGLQGPRHWLRSSPDGSQIAFLMKDDVGVVQLWTVSPHGGAARQVTCNPWPVGSAFNWSPDGCLITHVLDNSVWGTHVETGHGYRLTPRVSDAEAPRPEGCVFSPRGDRVAYVRNIPVARGWLNQVFVVEVPETLRFG